MKKSWEQHHRVMQRRSTSFEGSSFHAGNNDDPSVVRVKDPGRDYRCTAGPLRTCRKRVCTRRIAEKVE